MFEKSLNRIFKKEEPSKEQKEEKPDAQVIQADDYRDEFTPAMDTRIRELQKKQYSLEDPGAFTETDREELLKFKAKKESIEKSPWADEDESKLRELRKKQNSLEPGVYTETDKKELNDLIAKKKSVEWTDKEEAEYLVLSKENTDNIGWTPEKKERFAYLGKRREKFKNKYR